MLLAALTLTGVLQLLLYVAIVALLVVGVRYLLGLMGVTIPQPIMVVVGIIIVLVLLLWFFGGGVIRVR